MINKKHIIAIDFILLVGSLLLVAGLVSYARPLIIAPIDDLVTTENSILFEFEKASLILIDDNPEFTSPKKINVENNLVINLQPGFYYWKIVGALSSEIREFTIKSEINLKLKKSDSGEDSYQIINAGNLDLDVDILQMGEITGNIILKVDEEKEVSGTKFIGGENEN
ncbi:hypothetical protein CXX78_00255 [Candidatus Parvarchaeota archaeon]|nr:MAG: hypothetical protein CXX78_02035 [Candidatus Parvarchaeota archaeon]PXY71585.1 MAG: hypothetical protein CXX78_00255 [Candidatus Parvarchaeota archaeon]